MYLKTQGVNLKPGCQSVSSCRNCGGGSCSNDWDGETCHCPKGFTGPNCIDVCGLNPCLNEGRCKRSSTAIHGFTCNCKASFTGGFVYEYEVAICFLPFSDKYFDWLAKVMATCDWLKCCMPENFHVIVVLLPFYLPLFFENGGCQNGLGRFPLRYADLPSVIWQFLLSVELLKH